MSFSAIDDFFHTVAFSFNHYRFGMMQKPVKQRRCQRAVIVKISGQSLSPIGRDDQRSLFIEVADYLKEHIGTGFINGQIAQFI